MTATVAHRAGFVWVRVWDRAMIFGRTVRGEVRLKGSILVQSFIRQPGLPRWTLVLGPDSFAKEN